MRGFDRVKVEKIATGAWSRVRLCLRDGLAEVELDGESIVSAPAPPWLGGAATFAFSCWGWPVRIDDLEIVTFR